MVISISSHSAHDCLSGVTPCDGKTINAAEALSLKQQLHLLDSLPWLCLALAFPRPWCLQNYQNEQSNQPKKRYRQTFINLQGLVNVPFWGFWTSPSSICWRLYIIFPITSWVMFNQDNSPTPDLPLCVASGMRPKALKLSFKLMRLQSHGHGWVCCSNKTETTIPAGRQFVCMTTCIFTADQDWGKLVES